MSECFFEPSQFPWTESFRQQLTAIRDEVERQIQHMTPLYPQHTESVSGRDLTEARWFARTLVFFTIENPLVLKAMPATDRLLRETPGVVTAVLARLDPQTHIKPHCGYTPDVLRCHLGVVVPEDGACTLRVEKEQRSWKQGDWLIFDDYLEHEVWHRGTKSRTVLVVDVVRPGVERSPREIGTRFFSRVPGTRFDSDLEAVAKPEQWLQWLEAGQFPS